MSENCNYAPVEKVILIDDRRIEIYWANRCAVLIMKTIIW